MKTGVYLEYLGEVSADLIAKNLYRENPLRHSSEELQQAFPRGFMVSVQIEQQIYELPEERKAINESIEKQLHEISQGRLRRASGLVPPGRKIVGLVLTAL